MGVFSLVAAVSLSAGVSLAANYRPIPKDLTTPVQQRLAINGPNALSVGWSTYAPLNTSCVHYGFSQDDLCYEECSNTSETYHTSRSWFHAVHLTDLKPATKYFYKIVSTNSSVEQFLSPRPAGDETPFNVDIVIDLGVYGADGFTTKKRDLIPQVQPELNHSTIAQLAKTIDDYELVLHPGDFGYADDWAEKPHNLDDGKDAYQAILENFYDQLAPVAGRKPYMASPGNHEADCTLIKHANKLCPYGQRNFTDFMVRYGKTMPSPFPSLSKSHEAKMNAQKAKKLANPPFWYSFEYGMAHIVFIDTETDFPHAPDGIGGSDGLDSGPFGKSVRQQLEFLEADLASVDRTVTPWVFVAGHRPWYATGGPENICKVCQEAFEPLMYKYGVDVGIFGHVHNSQRFEPVYRNQTNPAGPMYIIAGGAGNIEGPVPIGETYVGNVFGYADGFSYAGMRLHNRTHLEIKYWKSDDGSMLDSSFFYREHSDQFVRQN